ncbi:MAG: MmgE/PrpD family protein [Rhodanobacteraceae bacterium]|nr:MAG: MmgE/PrpD family protein [Rhodanobacteraceae bacterium]
MVDVQELASFAHQARYARISEPAAAQLKIRILDTLGVMIGGLGARTRTEAPPTTASGRDMAAEVAARAASAATPFYAAAASDSLDFADVFVAAGGTCHPSDAIGPLLHAADACDVRGEDFVTAVAVSYQVQTRLSEMPQGAMAGVDPKRAGACARTTAEALLRARTTCGGNPAIESPAVAGAAAAARDEAYAAIGQEHPGAGTQDHVKRDAPNRAPETASRPRVASAGAPAIDWSKEDLESVLRTMTRIHYADIWAQPAIDASLTLATPPVFRAADVRAVRVKTFQAAYVALGGGDGMDRSTVASPAQAAGSLPYIVAVALLDRAVQQDQYRPERIARPDVRGLLHKVSIAPYAAFTARFPEGTPAQVDVELTGGMRFCTTAPSFRGSTLRPFDWGSACEKFYSLATPFVDDVTAERIARCVHDLESHRVRELTALLAKVSRKPWREATVRMT